MLSSTDDGEGEHFITNNNSSSRLSSSSSNSSFMSSSSAPLSTPRRKKTMEEVWKDINLSSSRDLSNPTSTGSSAGGMIFQDFLGRPFSNDPSSTSSVVSGDSIKAREASPLASLPQPAISLSLNSVPEFHFLENMDPLKPPSQLHSHVTAPSPFLMSSLTSSSSPFEAFGCSPAFSPFCNKKRASDSEDNSGDRRHKRMIKNRESAARSRARKQAYTNELEIEINNLKKEIARLRQEQEHQRQHEQRQSLLGRTAQLPKKHRLFRTSTAPF